MTPPPPDLPPLEKRPDWQLVAEALRILGNVPPGYGADLSLAIVAEAARRKLIERLKVKRYGRRKITTMLADWNDLRRIVADRPDDELQAAFDRCEEWVGFAMGEAGMKGDDMTDLDKLIEAVTAGRLSSYEPGFPPKLYGQWGLMLSAQNGDLNAAKRLHESLLASEDPQYGYLVGPQYARIVHPSGYICDATADSPARAWLLAILKAWRDLKTVSP